MDELEIIEKEYKEVSERIKEIQIKIREVVESRKYPDEEIIQHIATELKKNYDKKNELMIKYFKLIMEKPKTEILDSNIKFSSKKKKHFKL